MKQSPIRRGNVANEKWTTTKRCAGTGRRQILSPILLTSSCSLAATKLTSHLFIAHSRISTLELQRLSSDSRETIHVRKQNWRSSTCILMLLLWHNQHWFRFWIIIIWNHASGEFHFRFFLQPSSPSSWNNSFFMAARIKPTSTYPVFLKTVLVSLSLR